VILVARAYAMLIRFHSSVAHEEFAHLYKAVRDHPVKKLTGKTYSAEEICAAVDMASIWYWKEVLCLQRSAATVCLLRNCGIRAQLVIGAQSMPFKAHAWAEVDGRVVNDKPYVPEIYVVLNRC
jgi:hypothetical protein